MIEKMTAQAQELATHLGNDWTGNGYTERSFCLKRSDDLGLFVRYVDRSRYEISGNWGELYDFLPYLDYEARQRWGKITVSASRSPDAIALEINRRLLPVIIPAWEKAKEKHKQHTETVSLRHALTKKLAGILGETRLNNDGDGFTHYCKEHTYVKCYSQYHAQAVDLELRSVTPQQAEAILGLLAN